MVGTNHAVAGAQVMLNLKEQGSRRFCISHGAVSAARSGQAVKVSQRSKLVAWHLRVQPPRHEQGTGEYVVCTLVSTQQLGPPELGVKRSVVRHHGSIPDKPACIVHHLVGKWRASDHGIGDAGELGDESRKANACVHQTLEAGHDVPAFHKNNGNLCGTIAHGWRQAGCFKVNNGNQTHAQLPQHGKAAGKFKPTVCKTLKPFL